jgi:integrase
LPSAITRADIGAAAGAHQAARAFSISVCTTLLVGVVAWAMKEGLVDFNPVAATNDPEVGQLSRDRVLSDLELAQIWRACDDGIPGRIVKLLILLGCRRHEIGGLHRDEINLETGMLNIPGDRTKNGRALELALPPAALELIADMPRQGECIFSQSGRAFSGWSVLKMRLDLAIATATGRPLKPWRLHDLRRTFRTGLGKLGVPPHVAELCINHVKGGIQAVYDRYQYQPEIKMALARWAEHVLSIAEDREQKIIVLRA